MAWFKLAGEGCFHAKVLAAKNDAYGAWCRAGQWSSEHLTEGRIPRAVALTIAPVGVWTRLREAKAGSDHGLVEELADGWQIHDYLDWNPTAEQALAKREARVNAGRKGGEAKAARKQSAGETVAGDVTNGVAIASPVAKQPAKQNRSPSPSPSPSPLPDSDPEIFVAVATEPTLVPPAERHAPRTSPVAHQAVLTIVEPTKGRQRGAKLPSAPKPKTRQGSFACAFAEGHKQAGASNYAPPYFSIDLQGLLTIAETFCSGMADDEAVAWITFYAARFVRAFKADEELRYVKGTDGVQGFVTWLGRQSKRDMEMAEGARRAASLPNEPAAVHNDTVNVIQSPPVDPSYRPAPIVSGPKPVFDTTPPWRRRPVMEEQEAANE